MSVMPRLVACAVVLMLGACATHSVREDAVVSDQWGEMQLAAALAQHAAHEAKIGLGPGRDCTVPRWQMQGRVALSNGREGGSGRIEWEQGEGLYTVVFSAPVTRQSWRLYSDRNGARIEGLQGASRSHHDAEALLRELTGWDIPVAALACWTRAARADEARHGPAQLGFDANQRMVRIEQDGWRIDFSDWKTQPGLDVELPQRLTAVRGQAQVKLVVDTWSAVPETP